MGTYNTEQIDAIVLVREGLHRLSSSAVKTLLQKAQSYCLFREEVDAFLSTYFARLCTEKCFENQTSACCSRDGITTFFADVVINALLSDDKALDLLLDALHHQDPRSSKCVYLGKEGCLWRMKPIVCEMFLCEPAKQTVFTQDSSAESLWSGLKAKEKDFTWPSRPVLFEYLEHFFLQKGYDSSLMYFHNSPGLIRIRAQRKKQTNPAYKE
jgi:hypothetical protein